MDRHCIGFLSNQVCIISQYWQFWNHFLRCILVKLFHMCCKARHELSVWLREVRHCGNKDEMSSAAQLQTHWHSCHLKPIAVLFNANSFLPSIGWCKVKGVIKTIMIKKQSSVTSWDAWIVSFFYFSVVEREKARGSSKGKATYSLM